MIRRRLFLYAGLPCLAFLAACAHLRPELRRLDAMIEGGRWMTARERLDALLSQDPGDAELKRRLLSLNAAVEAQSDNLDFNPVAYFYAEAYKDYFDRGRYLDASQAMQQVLAYTLANEEVIGFLDKAQTRVAADSRRTKERLAQALERTRALFERARYAQAVRSAQMTLTLDSTNAEAAGLLQKSKEALSAMKLAKSAKAAKATVLAPTPAADNEPQPPLEPPDPQWVELRYREALRVYLIGDLAQAREILMELSSAQAPGAKIGRTLERIEKELRKKS